MIRVVRPLLLAALIALLAAPPAAAQIVPWLEAELVAGPVEPTADGERRVAQPRPDEPAVAADAPDVARDPAAAAPERRRRIERRARQIESAAMAETPVWFDPRDEPVLFAALSEPATILLSNFAGNGADGAVRSSTTWVGQTTQQAETLVVAGTARDDNGWGATGLSLNAGAMLYLNITAQRDAGNLAPTLFVQFEDLSLRTKIVSVSTAQFALGSQTLVQIPLNGWTIDFGPSQITGWSLGGGSVGTTDFRMTFDSLSLTATAIPEPATVALLAATAALGATAWRRRKSGASLQAPRPGSRD
jgi:hypothetical protein